MTNKPTLDGIFEWVYDDGTWCAECDNYVCHNEYHGDRFQMPERLCECQADDARACPGVEAVLNELIQEFNQ